MSSKPSAFVKPTSDQAKRWYNWIASLDISGGNPFDPNDAGMSVKRNQNDKELYFLAAIVATNAPAKQTIQIPNSQAIAKRAEGTAVYVSGEGSTTQQPPTIEKKVITIPEGRSLYLGISTELATQMKYPKFDDLDKLAKLAKDIIAEEENSNEKNPNQIAGAYVEFTGAVEEKMTGGQLKDMIVEGTFEEITFPDDNVFLIPVPPNSGKAAFHDCSVIVDWNALKVGETNYLKYGHHGKSLKYDVVYEITVGSSSATSS